MIKKIFKKKKKKFKLLVQKQKKNHKNYAIVNLLTGRRKGKNENIEGTAGTGQFLIAPTYVQVWEIHLNELGEKMIL